MNILPLEWECQVVIPAEEKALVQVSDQAWIQPDRTVRNKGQHPSVLFTATVSFDEYGYFQVLPWIAHSVLSISLLYDYSFSGYPS